MLYEVITRGQAVALQQVVHPGRERPRLPGLQGGAQAGVVVTVTPTYSGCPASYNFV